MFGNSSITSSWGQPQQNQQQGASAFGQPATTGFGTGSAFGSGGAFGQQQPPQQPQANPMFGNLANPSTSSAGASGFGTFGSTNTSNSGGLFGPPKPAAGFGTFSGGGTSTFGTPPNTAGPSTGGGLFGTQNTSGTSTFGTGLFGGAKPAAFGPTTQIDPATPVTTGTANPPYSVYDEKDSNTIVHYQSITCMPAYRASSFEELRSQDYQQGRKTAGAFGQTTFGAPAQPSNSIFGQSNPGATGTNPLFSGGTFGSTNNSTAPATTGFGTFGPSSNAGTSGGGLFGSFGQPQTQQQQPQQPSGFGAFSQPQQQQQQQQPAGGGLFNASGTFGSTQNKPFGGFGAGATGTFGSTPQQPAPGGSIFGQNQQQQGTSAFSGFGQNATKPGIFGTQPAQQTNTFGGFGAQPQQGQQGAQQTGGLLGSGGLFNTQQPQGQQPGQQQQQPSIFGNPSAQQPQQGTGLFSGGLFSNANAQQQQPPQQPAQGFGLFGNKPATTASTGLFGNTFGQSTSNATTPAQPQSSIFGQPLGQPATSQQGLGAFGSGSLFPKAGGSTLGVPQANSQPAGNTFGGSFFNSTLGSSTTTTPVAPPLTASIAQPIGANLPIFSMLPPGPRAVTLDQQPKKKSSLFNDVPTRSPVPRLQLSYSPATSRLRGFTSTSAGGNGSAPLSLTSGKPGALSLSKAASKSLLGPDAFLSSSVSQPGLGSGGRQSVKKLILDKKVEPSDLFSKSTAFNSPKVTFNPALSVAAREIEAAGGSTASQRSESPGPAPRANVRKPGLFTAHSTATLVSGPRGRSTTGAPATVEEVDESEGPAKLQEGDYYVKPDLDVLRQASYEELVAFEGLVVGRVGYGEIHFLDPVDLTGLPKLGSLLGEIVRFDDKECSVYPDSDDVDKPAPGSGLNVHARIELVRCWALDKAKREPIKDAKHPMAVRHYKRLKHMKDTHFEGFDIEEGKWTFMVDHF